MSGEVLPPRVIFSPSLGMQDRRGGRPGRGREALLLPRLGNGAGEGLLLVRRHAAPHAPVRGLHLRAEFALTVDSRRDLCLLEARTKQSQKNQMPTSNCTNIYYTKRKVRFLNRKCTIL